MIEEGAKMFTNIATYLLGYAESRNTVTAIDNEGEVRLRAVEAEDDWLMVEKSEGTQRNSVQDENVLSRSSSTFSLPCLSMEESWFVTPPPCFTSAGPVMLETSPLENLLIEHPSMSVYHHSSPALAPPRQPPRARSEEPAPSLAPLPLGNNNRKQQNRRQHTLYQQQQEALAIPQIRTAQKQEARRSGQKLKRGQLERSNKTREFSSRSRRQRRADRQNKHSGANNNRKCC